MKKIIVFTFSLFISIYSIAQKGQDRAIKKGFNLTTSIGINTANAGIQLPDYNWDKSLYAQFQIGTYWYIKPQTKWALGIKTSWIDISYIKATTLIEGTDEDIFSDGEFNFDEGSKINKLISLSAITFGPIGTYAITPNIAIDGFYNLRPTFVFAETSINGIGKQPGFGLSHLVGTAFRVGIFNIGFEYIFGSIKPISDNIADAVDNIDDATATSQKIGRIENNYMRIVVGCKF
jgi:hypothetical protein